MATPPPGPEDFRKLQTPSLLGPDKVRSLHPIHRDEVQHRVFPFKKRGEFLYLILPVIHAADQHPLILNRVLHRVRIRLGAADDFCDGKRSGLRDQMPALLINR